MSSIHFVLADHFDNWIQLNPLSLTKSIAQLRIGILTIQEKWEFLLHNNVGIKTCVPQLHKLNTWEAKQGETYIFINSSFLPNKALLEKILELKEGESLYASGTLVASKVTLGKTSFEKELAFEGAVLQINHPWDLFSLNAQALEQDFELLCNGRKSQTLSNTNTLIGSPNQIFLEEGAQVEASILNTTTGPIYLGKNAEIMEGSIVRGGLALCEGAQLKLGTKIYGATTIGPFCKVGGEVNNSVLQSYSNKGHDGFLGNSVIGSWCNLGADTNNSNLKNNYGKVSVYSYKQKDYVNSGLQFLGLIMGDHSKCGINTMFNTGTVVGVFANIFGGDFPPKYIPSFSWGGSVGFSAFDLDKAFEVAERVMERRKVPFTQNDKEILSSIYQSEQK